MLVLSRKQGERIVIDNNVVVTVIECRNGRVRLGFEAPQSVDIVREEIAHQFHEPSYSQEPVGAMALENG